MQAAMQGAAAGMSLVAALGTWAAVRRSTRSRRPPRTVTATPVLEGRVRVATRDDLAAWGRWSTAFASQRKDRRYYEVVEDTIRQGFDYRYFVIEDDAGRVGAIQPFFVHDQDLLAGSAPSIRRAVGAVRRVWPRCLKVRTLMVGCAAGEGHLDDGSDADRAWVARALHEAIRTHARQAKARLVVLKEFHAAYREPLGAFSNDGFARVPSLPMTRLNIDYANFDDYLARGLSKAARKDLRRKFRWAEERCADEPIEMQVLDDITPVVDEVYPLYLQVFARSHLQFEKLTKEYLCAIGRRMPDKVRFFVWRKSGRVVAFSLCMFNGDTLYDEYLGLDYAVALDLHLYFHTFRDVVSWAMTRGLKWYVSSALNYEPKLHFGCELVPLDLYVAHTSVLPNMVMRRVLPLLDPTRGDPTLKKFPNYADLHAGAGSAE